ncbi:ABC transporter substrate-binding protein [Planosporangium mesophilum]|uniref:Sugar ABC transporter substrate-binding protein n=1 Tax=Planosporangium mesophilum TaxID=689768 RepID=A0A8J3TI07_9ACTN|nr:ABC transporter substrate-binding protein [Planosporangium mesophilum]NJC85983.1 substrate-binding domain-containing protein [Planosporangium mesophilum]GII25916.1 sugar ABC transporter substrate-binding protein [Planosporangium mesophilum]
MRTNRTLATLAVAVLAVAASTVAGCGNADDSGGSGGSGKKKITLIQGVANEPFYTSMYCGAKDEAATLDVDLEVTAAAKWDVAQQTTVANAVTAKRPDAVLIAPVDKEAMAGPVRLLAGSGSKVIFVDTELSDTSLGLSRVASDNRLGGHLGAKSLARLVGDKGKVLVLAPARGIATTDDRVAGFKAELAAHPGVALISEQYPGDDAAKAQAVVSATLAAHPDLAGIFAANLVTGEGAASALKSAGRTGAVKLVEFDASPAQVEALKAGAIQALISQEPLDIGRQGVRQAVNALDGKPVQARISTQLVEVTKDNLNDPKVAQYLYRSTC